MVQFKVFYLDNEKLITEKFASFASAAGHAEGLKTRVSNTVFIWAEISHDGYSHSGSLYKYRNDTRELVNKGFLNIVLNELKGA